MGQLGDHIAPGIQIPNCYHSHAIFCSAPPLTLSSSFLFFFFLNHLFCPSSTPVLFSHELAHFNQLTLFYHFNHSSTHFSKNILKQIFHFEILSLDCGGGYTTLCLSKLTELHIKKVNFTICKLYMNEPNYKNKSQF